MTRDLVTVAYPPPDLAISSSTGPSISGASGRSVSTISSYVTWRAFSSDIELSDFGVGLGCFAALKSHS